MPDTPPPRSVESPGEFLELQESPSRTDEPTPPSTATEGFPTALGDDGDCVELVPNLLDIGDALYDVNDAIEKAGWGWYQHKVLFVMGLMSFADCAEITLATIIIKDLKCEWDLTSAEDSLIPAVVYFFYAIGSMVSGYFSDKYGRYWVLLVNSAALVLSGIGSGFAPEFYSFIFFRSVAGFCIGGNYACSIVYAQEVMPAKLRSWNMFFLEMYWILGALYESVIALCVMQLDNGWRYQILLTALPIVAMMVAMYFMDESPRYLVINNRKEEAQKVLEKICRDNKVDVIDGDLYAKDERSGDFLEIWAKPKTCESLQISIHFICNMFLLFGITMMIPDAMAYDYCGLDMSFNSTYVNAEGCPDARMPDESLAQPGPSSGTALYHPRHVRFQSIVEECPEIQNRPEYLGIHTDSNGSQVIRYDVNDVIERAGWGWYQHKVLLVMGAACFVDSAELLLQTIIIPNLECLWSLSSIQKAVIPSSIFICYAVGSMTSGYFADKFGRYWVLMINIYALLISSICSGFASNYYVYVIFRSIVGFCVGGNYACSVIYAQEFMPVKFRSWNILFLALFWSAGGIYECCAAILVMKFSNGWRYQIFLTGLPIVAMLVAMYFMDESPRYLVINNRKEEAQKVLEKICKDNKVDVIDGDLYAKDERRGEFLEIWAKPKTCESLQISIHFICNMFLLFGITMMIPDAMAYDYCGLDMSFNSTYVNAEGCTVYTRAEYLFMMITAVMYFPGMLMATGLSDFIGRKHTFIFSIYGGALFTFFLLLCINAYVTYTMLCIATIFYSAYNQVLWVYTPEFYATYMRGTACGIQNGIGKFGAAAGTFLTTYLDEYDVSYTIYCYIAVQLVACVTVLFMRRETAGQNLQDSPDARMPDESLAQPGPSSGTALYHPRHVRFQSLVEECPEIQNRPEYLGIHTDSNGSQVIRYDVNDVIERAGWGWYQHKVLLVMGAACFVDSAELLLQTIIIPNLECLWSLSSIQKAVIPSSIFICYAVGSMTSGYFADKFGRYWVLMINIYALLISSICSGFASNYYVYVIFRSIVGFCVGGNYACSVIYAQEFMPVKFRSWNILFLALFWSAGGIYECCAAILVMKFSNGWRYQIFLTGLPIVAMLVAMYFMDESPRYLVINNRKEEAQQVLEKICSDNKIKHIKGELYVQDERNGAFSEIWAKPHTSGSIQMTIHFICNTFLVSGVLMLIPLMMSHNYCDMNLWFNTTHIDAGGCTVYTAAEFEVLMVIELFFLPGMLIAAVLSESVGRRSTVIVAVFAGAGFTLMLAFCWDISQMYTILFFCVFFYGAYNEVIFLYAIEFYATYMRGTAFGAQNGIGKLGAAVATFITTAFNDSEYEYVVYCYVAVEVVGCVTACFMKRETVGQLLWDTRSSENILHDEEPQERYGSTETE
eukprot:sb/3460963/